MTQQFLSGGGAAICPTSEQRKTTKNADDLATTTLQPASDFVILIDNSSGAVDVELDPPDACEPSVFLLKLRAANSFDVTVTPTSGLIEGGASVTFSTTVGVNFPSSMYVFFDGIDWHLISGYQQFEQASLAKNDGQVKLNAGNGLQPEWNSGTPSINGTYQQVAYAMPFSFSGFPTTSWPLNIATPVDADFYLSATDTFLENTILGQSHIWRIQITFSKNSAQTTIFFRIRNTLSGFVVTQTTSVSSGVNNGTLLLNIITIADAASLPAPFGVGQGYEMHVLASDGSFEVGARFLRIDSIARISLHHSIRY